MVVIYEGVRRPEPLPQLFPRHELPRATKKVEQDFERLPQESGTGLSVLAQLSGAAIELKYPEAKKTVVARSFRQSLRLPKLLGSILDEVAPEAAGFVALTD
jgi:hypothetical protein